MVAGGKTGGHLFPGIAVAEALKRRIPEAAIRFAGPGTRFELQALAPYGFEHTAIVSSGIKGKGILEKLKALARVPVSLVQAAWIVGRFRPDLVLGVGGYSSGPVVLAARLMGVKTAIQEQNSVPGITNRILSRIVHAIFTGFQETRGFPLDGRVVWTGNPVRRSLGSHGDGAGSEAGGGSGRFTVLVTGGSQGASSINRAVIEALPLLKDPGAFRFIHQTGDADEATVSLAYRSHGMEAVVRPFFQEMPALLAGADLVVCRAGAGTLAEITTSGRPSILVPYPHAADDHQRFNALALVDRGAAVMIEDRNLSGASLKQALETLKNDGEALATMAARSRELGMPAAAEVIADHCLALVMKRGN
jgi:UDP-N-acetylglucosamine--N-acetylmuramyl-(pentapeptide) pyrophosphoryl-undecaprenol N-acetylglucosamine transferase